MNIGDATLVLNIGQKVLFDGFEYEICDIGYRTPEGSFVSSSTGQLHYNLLNADKASIGWVLATSVTSKNVTVEEDTNSEFFDMDGRSPHLEELGYNMVSWLDGLPPQPDNDTLPPILTLMMAVQYDKEKGYGSSWKMRGEYRSIIPNIDRKFDRLSKITDDEMDGKVKSLAELEQGLVDGTLKPEDVGESKIDSILDLATYSVLYGGLVRQQYPNVFKVWVDKNIPKYLADKIPFI